MPARPPHPAALAEPLARAAHGKVGEGVSLATAGGTVPMVLGAGQGLQRRIFSRRGTGPFARG